MTHPRRGRCTLVGAGPGDPELLTLKAVKAIREATVLLVDDLVGDDVLAHALRGRRRWPRIVHVGKRGGCRSTPQAFIERLMVAEARRGERVVRLKGGDPMLFGRAGEELAALRAAGIDIEVVPGITAGLAAAASLGASLTRRTCAHGVMFVTGHAHPDAGERGWASVAHAAADGITLVVYMGVAQAPSLVAGLRPHLDDATPVAVVQHASLPNERRVASTLGTLIDTIAREQVGSPAIIVIGDVLQGMTAIAALPASERAQPEGEPLRRRSLRL